MELRDERAEFFEECDSNFFEVLLDIGGSGVAAVRRSEAGDVAIESNGAGLCGHLPLRGAEEDADVMVVNGSDARRNGFGFEGMVDSAEENGIAGNEDDGATAGEVGDDFVFLGRDGSGARQGEEEKRGSHEENGVHRGRVAQRVERDAERWKRRRIGSRGRQDSLKWRDGREETLAMGLKNLKRIKHKGKTLEEILKAHEMFWASKEGGARADLTGADLSDADLREVNLAGAILRDANLEGSDLRGARLPGADFSGANLRKADLRKVDLTESFLPGANLSEAQASGVEFFRCDLTGANFEKAILRNVNFRDAHLQGAKFAGADMGIAILRETDLTNVDLSQVDLSTALMPKGWGVKKQGA